MNCKQGDLAVIVSAKNDPTWLGRFVKVVREYDDAEDFPAWVTDPMPDGFNSVYDHALRPIPAIDYTKLIADCYRTLKHPQGTKGCIAFARGAEWMRDQFLAAKST